MRTLLTVDFDFFARIPERFEGEWTHSEGRSDVFQDMLWTTRAADLMRAGVEPSSMLAMEPEALISGLVDRGLRLRSAYHLYVADSHRWGGPWAFSNHEREMALVNFDAHHDLGYQPRRQLDKLMNNGHVDCASWARTALLKNVVSRYQVVYPEWKGDSELRLSVNPKTHIPKSALRRVSFDVWPKPPALEGRVVSVLLVRSGAWSPPWLDDAWLRLVRGMENATGCFAMPMGGIDVSKPRSSPLEAARSIAELTQRLLMRAGNPLDALPQCERAETGQGKVAGTAASGRSEESEDG